jgi:MFS transporter, DHA2 family, multidrug resistance protein
MSHAGRLRTISAGLNGESGQEENTGTPGPQKGFTRVANHGLLTVAVMAASIMQSLDSTIANVALPKMQGEISATQDQMGWVLTSYIVASAIMIPLTGWLAGRFGRKPVFLISIAGFTITSALCGMSGTLTQIVVFRLLQGMSGAALVPLSQALLFDINPPENYGKAMAVWGMGATMGPILGPALGGWLTENYSWHWVFYINLPIGLASFLVLSALMPNTEKQDRNFDFFGFLTLSLGIGALQMMMDRGELKDWFGSAEIISEAVLAGLGLYLFMVHMFTHDRPFVSPALFKDRNFITCSIYMFLVGIILFATLSLLPPMLQHNMGYPVETTGFITAPRGMGSMLSMFLVSRIAMKMDVRLVMAVGLGLTAFTLWQMTQFSLYMNSWPVIISGFLQGVGISLTYVPLSTLAFATLAADLRNEGTAFFNLMRNIGSAVGISIVQFLLIRNTQIMHATMTEHIMPYNTGSMAYMAIHADTSSLTGLAGLNAMITNQAAMIGYINDFYLMMVITLAVIPLLLILKKPVNPAAKEEVVVMD